MIIFPVCVNSRSPITDKIEVENNISDNYVDDESLKIEIHKKISTIENLIQLKTLKNEFEDRFGKLSENIIVYMYERLFENKSRKLGITNIKQEKNKITITLPKEYSKRVEGDRLFIDILSLSSQFRFSYKNDSIIIILQTTNLDKNYIYYLLELIEIIDKNIN